ncbi:hypothetical protein [Azospirillum picis]|uniref:Chemotaxis protein histidine kinase CheA n=1 Tax=Azospirillum picis TaxID=488438 RepID=A0ABU0MPY6_9PROT|nr:hypothetical protein [Azospirillum picis]MBP2301567.1 chemotaxis protein histidine kinase CheA [Azospirillum picis]MDQ0535399.1 chemotaxis protein histidine kinase CheA [Azospirillum picis]
MTSPVRAVRLMILRAPDDGGGAAPAADTSLSVSDAVGLLRSARQEPETPASEPPPVTEQAPPAQNAATEAEQAHEEAPSDQGEPEPAEAPAIEPPKSWSKADQDAFLAPPPEVQQVVARRESERDRAFQAKTTEAAEARKAAEAQTAAVEAERARYAQNLAFLAKDLQANMGPEPDWQRLAQEDPAGYVRAKADWDARAQKLQAAMAEHQRVTAQVQQQQQQRHAAKLAEENAKLVDAIEGWKEPATAKKEFGDVMAYLGKEYGYDDTLLNGIDDHRLVVLARKAMLYDRAKAGVQSAAKPVPQVQRPGTSSGRTDTQNRDALVKRLERSGDVKDAVALLRAKRMQ